jgi:hypothetical protein
MLEILEFAKEKEEGRKSKESNEESEGKERKLKLELLKEGELREER